MITYKFLFEALKNPDTTKTPADFQEGDWLRALKMMQILCHAEIAIYDKESRMFKLHPKQVKHPITIVSIPPKTAVSSGLGRVHVDWRGTGHSSGSYAVLAESGTHWQIQISTSEKNMAMWVAKARCKRVEIVVKEQAA